MKHNFKCFALLILLGALVVPTLTSCDFGNDRRPGIDDGPNIDFPDNGGSDLPKPEPDKPNPDPEPTPDPDDNKDPVDPTPDPEIPNPNPDPEPTPDPDKPKPDEGDNNKPTPEPTPDPEPVVPDYKFIFEFTDIGERSVSFNYSLNTDFKIDYIELYNLKSNKVEQVIKTNVNKIENLHINSMYKINICYTVLKTNVTKLFESEEFCTKLVKLTPKFEKVIVENKTITYKVDKTAFEDFEILNYGVGLYLNGNLVEFQDKHLEGQFTNLSYDTTYEVKFACTYYLPHPYIQDEAEVSKTVTTGVNPLDNTIKIGNISKTKNSISYELRHGDGISVLSSKLYKWEGETFICDANNNTFSGLESFTTYYFVIEYMDLVTNEKATVTSEFIRTDFDNEYVLSFKSVIPSCNSVSYEINMLEELRSYYTYSVSIYKNDEVIETLNNNLTGTFYNLIDLTSYDIVLKYKFEHPNLKEPLPEQAVRSTFKTTKDETKEYIKLYVTSDLSNEIDFEVRHDAKITVKKIDLYENSTFIRGIPLNENKVTGLTKDTEYKFVITYTILGDENFYTYESSTIITNPGIIDIGPNCVASETSMTFEFLIVDLVGFEYTNIETSLYKDDVLIDSINGQTKGTYNGLIDGSDYVLKYIVSYRYDHFPDGVVLTGTAGVTTPPSEASLSYRIDKVDATYNSISFEFSHGKCIKAHEFRLYDLASDELVQTISADERTFTNLLDDHVYYIKFQCEYLLSNDIHEEYLCETKTLARSYEPTFKIRSQIDNYLIYDILFPKYDDVRFELDTINLKKSGETAIYQTLDMAQGTFSNLDPSSTYSYTINYHYYIGANGEPINNSVEGNFVTGTATSDMIISLEPVLNVGTTTLSFEVPVAGEYSSRIDSTEYALYDIDNNFVIHDERVFSATISDLKPNTRYDLYFWYYYNQLNPNYGTNRCYCHKYFTTKNIDDVILIDDIVYDDQNISYSIDTSKYSVQSVSLLQNGQKIATTYNSNDVFKSLNSGTEYVIEVNYKDIKTNENKTYSTRPIKTRVGSDFILFDYVYLVGQEIIVNVGSIYGDKVKISNVHFTIQKPTDSVLHLAFAKGTFFRFSNLGYETSYKVHASYDYEIVGTSIKGRSVIDQNLTTVFGELK